MMGLLMDGVVDVQDEEYEFIPGGQLEHIKLKSGD